MTERRPTIGSLCGEGGVVAGRHVFPWVEIHKTETHVNGIFTITIYCEPPKTCQCGVVKETVFRETGA